MHSRDGLNRIQVLCAGKGGGGGALTEELRGGVIQREREEGRTNNTLRIFGKSYGKHCFICLFKSRYMECVWHLHFGDNQQLSNWI